MRGPGVAECELAGAASRASIDRPGSPRYREQREPPRATRSIATGVRALTRMHGGAPVPWTRWQLSGVADLVGRVLAGRYRLLAPIGAGASGRVYVADDVRLRRRVAVKVLHGGLAEDAGFLRRFRTEAQLAASLHHPHIVAVYDWGEDDGCRSWSSSSSRAESLRALLDAGGRLTPVAGGPRRPPGRGRARSTRTPAGSCTAT